MKILIVGADSNYAIESYYVKYLKNILGTNNIEIFKSQNIFLEYYNKNICHKLIYRLGFSTIFKKINSQLLDRINNFQPEVVLIFKGMEIFPSTLKIIKSRKIKLINYNPDHPFQFHGRGSGNKNVLKGITYYDLYLTYSKIIQTQLKQKFHVKTGWLPFGFELAEQEYDSIQNIVEENRVCFLGNPDKERADFIYALSQNNIPVTVYGHDWDKWIKENNNLNIQGAVYQKEFWQVIRNYRVQLNLFRPHNFNSHNMRSFEVPAAGGIMLARLTDEHTLFFEADKEAFYFKDFAQCLQKCQVLLNLSKIDAHKIRVAARKRSISSDYSYQNRAKQLIEIIKSI